MTRRPPLSKAETEIARIVWDRGGGTVREVWQALPAGRQLEYKTVQTYLRRLEAKGYLKTQPRGRSLWYSPKVRPLRVIRETVDDFVRRLFDGEALPLVEHLIRDSRLSRDELRAVRELLQELEDASDDA